MAAKLNIQDPYELINTHSVEEFKNGQILVTIQGFTSYMVEHYTPPYSDKNFKFYDEEHSWQECVVTLILDDKNSLTKYKRFNTILSNEYGPSSFAYLFVPIDQLI